MKVALFTALVFALSAIPLSAVADSKGSANSPPMQVGTSRPELDFATMNGGYRPIWDQLRGNVVVIDFWATWCPPCIASIPKLNALQRRFAGKPVVFYSVTYEKQGAVRALLTKMPLDTQVSLDNNFHTFEAFNAWGIPVIYIFDKTGRLAATTESNNLDAAAIQAVLDGKSPSLPPAESWSDPKGAEKYFRSLRDKQAD